MRLTGEAKFLLGILVGTLAIIGLSLVFFGKSDTAEQAVFTRDQLVASDSITYGNASASAYLVEFSDYQCPACRLFDPVLTGIRQDYGDRLLVVYRHFPLDQHPEAVPAARAAEAAGKQGKYWEMHELLFENQSSLGQDLYQNLAEELGLDMDMYADDAASDAVAAKIDADRLAAIRLGVNATPTFYLNGAKLNLMGPDDLRAAVDEALK